MTRQALTVIIVLMLMLSFTQVQALKFGHRREGSNDMETRELSLDSFQALEVDGTFAVDIRIGKKQKVKVTIDDNLWEHLDAKVTGQWLKVDWDRGCRPSKDCRIEIVVPHLREVAVHGAADIDIHDFKGPRFKYNLSGAGNLNMDGEVDELEIRISGAGDANTKDLKAKHVDVKVSGAGDATVYASKSLRARVSGIGNLVYYGDPQDKDTSVSGIGSIKAR